MEDFNQALNKLRLGEMGAQAFVLHVRALKHMKNKVSWMRMARAVFMMQGELFKRNRDDLRRRLEELLQDLNEVKAAA